jgi:uncharacterized protein YpmS
MKKLHIFILIILVILASILACNLPFSSKLSEPTQAAVTPTEGLDATQAVAEVEEEIESVIATVQSGGAIEMEFTEAQLTTLAASELEKYSEVSISDIHIGLQAGQIQISGKAQSGAFNLPAEIVIAVQTDGKGGLDYQVVHAVFGPLPIPESMLNEMTQQLEIGIGDQLIGSDVYIDDVTIENGILVIKGHIP